MLRRKTTNNLNRNLVTGFRLKRLEVYNWGTFDGTVLKVEPNGKTALLTGKNGSGKSTLVDAILTLLVPNPGGQKRNYNQASGSDGKQERSELSYVRGAFGQKPSEYAYKGETQYLRTQNDYSVLLGVFNNAGLETDVSLAQIFWHQGGKLNKFFIVAHCPLSIAEDFSVEDDMKSLRARLRKRHPDVQLFEQFNQYSTYFRKAFHLRSEKALDLFNQIVAIKEIGGLNEFVRRHMLENTDVQTHITELSDNYENLTRAYDAIQKAERQLEQLRPIIDEANRYENLQGRIEDARRLSTIVPHFFTVNKRRLLSQAIEKSKSDLASWESEDVTKREELSRFRQREKDIEFSIRDDSVGQRLNELKRDLQQAQREATERRKQRTAYDALAKRLKLPDIVDIHRFEENRSTADTYLRQADSELGKVADTTFNIRQEEQRLNKIHGELLNEIEILQQRKSQIPFDDLRIREQIIQQLGIPEESIPFVGELLKVKEEYSQIWEPAIQRLMRNFGRQMIVPESHYKAIVQFVNKTNLKGRLVYHRVPQVVESPSLSHLRDDTLIHKVQVRSETAFRGWLLDKLVNRYDYICCDTLDQFQHESRAITPQGQMKHGNNQHEKDDRHALGDLRGYVLGWDNQDKIAALEAALASTEMDLKKCQRQLTDLTQKYSYIQGQRDALRDLINFDDFSRVDWASVQQRIKDFEAEHQRLTAASNQLQALESELTDVRDQINDAEQEHARLQQTIGTLSNDINRFTDEQNKCDKRLRDVQQVEALQAEFESIAAEAKVEFTLSNIDEENQRLGSLYQNRINSLQGQLNQVSGRIIPLITNFKRDYPSETDDVDSSIDAIGWFRDKYTEIERDNLPQHRERFKLLMQHKIMGSIQIFRQTLEQQEDDIQRSIDRLNESLKSIPYTTSTYIQLQYQRNPDQEVQRFKNDLPACYPNVGRDGESANEIAFQNIRQLIKRLEDPQERRWREKVTDVRNWLDFSAVEYRTEDDSVREHYDSSSGKSGGQKAKLAYTILASAIAYQYGLDQREGQQQDQTFRFVVVDEVFSKSDEANSQFAMDLFKQLQLQVLVVTPMDKIHVVEPYIGSCHYVWNNDDGSHSQLRNLSIQQLHDLRTETQMESVSL